MVCHIIQFLIIWTYKCRSLDPDLFATPSQSLRQLKSPCLGEARWLSGIDGLHLGRWFKRFTGGTEEDTLSPAYKISSGLTKVDRKTSLHA